MSGERVPKLTTEHRDELIRWLDAGLPIEVSARLAGLSPATVTEWRSRSARGVRGYTTFEEDVLHAMARGEAAQLARIAEAGRTQWRASAWLLERMYPEKYAPPMPTVPPDAASLPAAQHDFDGL